MSRSNRQRDDETPYAFSHTGGYHHDDMPVIGRTHVDPHQYPLVAQHLQFAQSPPGPPPVQPIYTHHVPAAHQAYAQHHPHTYYVGEQPSYAAAPPPPLQTNIPPPPHPFAGAMMQSPAQTDFSNHSGMPHGFHQFNSSSYHPSGIPRMDAPGWQHFPEVYDDYRDAAHKGMHPGGRETSLTPPSSREQSLTPPSPSERSITPPLHHSPFFQQEPSTVHDGGAMCEICHEICPKPMLLTCCNSVYGKRCIEGYLYIFDKCPNCNARVPRSKKHAKHHDTAYDAPSSYKEPSRWSSSQDGDRAAKRENRRNHRAESQHMYGDPRSSAPLLSSARQYYRPEERSFAPASPPTPPLQHRRASVQINQRPPLAHHSSSEQYLDNLKNLNIARPPSTSIDGQPRRRERGRSFNQNRNSGTYALYGDPRRSEPSFGGDPRRSQGSLNNYDGVAYVVPDPTRLPREPSRHREQSRVRAKSRRRQSPPPPPPEDSDRERHSHRHRHHKHSSRRSSPSEYERSSRPSRPSSPNTSSEASSVVRRAKSRPRYSQSRPRAPEYIEYRPPSRSSDGRPTNSRVDLESNGSRRPTSSRYNRAPSPYYRASSSPPPIAPPSPPTPPAGYRIPRPPSPSSVTPSPPSPPFRPRTPGGNYHPPTVDEVEDSVFGSGPSTPTTELPPVLSPVERVSSQSSNPSDNPPPRPSKTSYGSTNLSHAREDLRPSGATGRKERAGVQPGQSFTRPDLICCMTSSGLCEFAVKDGGDPGVPEHNKLLRLDCGHGYHHECLRSTIAMKDRTSTRKVDLGRDKLWCERCRKEMGKKAGQ